MTNGPKNFFEDEHLSKEETLFLLEFCRGNLPVDWAKVTNPWVLARVRQSDFENYAGADSTILNNPRIPPLERLAIATATGRGTMMISSLLFRLKEITLDETTARDLAAGTSGVAGRLVAAASPLCPPPLLLEMWKWSLGDGVSCSFSDAGLPEGEPNSGAGSAQTLSDVFRHTIASNPALDDEAIVEITRSLCSREESPEYPNKKKRESLAVILRHNPALSDDCFARLAYCFPSLDTNVPKNFYRMRGEALLLSLVHRHKTFSTDRDRRVVHEIASQTTNTSVLMTIAELAKDSQLLSLALADNPSCPQGLLQAFISSGNLDRVLAAVANPAVTPAMLLQVVRVCADDAAKFSAAVDSEKEPARKTIFSLLYAVSCAPGITAEIARLILEIVKSYFDAADYDTLIKSLTENPTTPSEILEQLASEAKRGPTTLAALVGHQSLPANVMATLWEEAKKEASDSMASRRGRLLEQFAHGANSVALQINLGLSASARKNQLHHVGLAAVNNPAAPEGILLELCRSENSDLAEAAVNRLSSRSALEAFIAVGHDASKIEDEALAKISLSFSVTELCSMLESDDLKTVSLTLELFESRRRDLRITQLGRVITGQKTSAKKVNVILSKLVEGGIELWRLMTPLVIMRQYFKNDPSGAADYFTRLMLAPVGDIHWTIMQSFLALYHQLDRRPEVFLAFLNGAANDDEKNGTSELLLDTSQAYSALASDEDMTREQKEVFFLNALRKRRKDWRSSPRAMHDAASDIAARLSEPNYRLDRLTAASVYGSLLATSGEALPPPAATGKTWRDVLGADGDRSAAETWKPASGPLPLASSQVERGRDAVFTVKLATESHELIGWGDNSGLSLCVGNGHYAKEAERGEIYILGLFRDEKIYGCIEVEAGDLSIEQARLYDNKDMTDELANAAVEVLRVALAATQPAGAARDAVAEAQEDAVPSA